jgi:hypothetical protein
MLALRRAWVSVRYLTRGEGPVPRCGNFGTWFNVQGRTVRSVARNEIEDRVLARQIASVVTGDRPKRGYFVVANDHLILGCPLYLL